MASTTANQQVVRPDLAPSSKESEMAVLSCLLNDAGSWNKVVSRLSDSDFFFRENQLIFAQLAGQLDAGEHVDIITLSEYLKRDGLLNQVGDIKYLTELKLLGASSDAMDHYVTTVKEKAQLRSLQLIGQSVAADASIQHDPTAIVEQLEKQLSEIRQDDGLSQGGFESLGASIHRVVDKIDDLFNGEGGTPGLSTGFDELDSETLGLQPADMVIVAGRPSMGKTSFAMNIGENAASAGNKVAVFSLEMPTDALTTRMFSSIGRIDQKRLRTGQLDEEDWPRLTNAISVLTNMPLYIDDTPSLSISEFRARARRLHKEHDGLDLIIIDYLQLMRSSGKLVNNRAEEISDISRNIKAVAKELNVPIIALSQLNRTLEQRTNKRPIMSDLRESGAIEQDADLILFVYRDEVYNEDSPDKGKAEIIIGKQRNGPLGTIPLSFEGQYTRFHNLFVDSDYTHEYGNEGLVSNNSQQASTPEAEASPAPFDVDDSALFADDVSAKQAVNLAPADPADDGLAMIPADNRQAVASVRDQFAD